MRTAALSSCIIRNAKIRRVFGVENKWTERRGKKSGSGGGRMRDEGRKNER